jgi:hypothetical protein
MFNLTKEELKLLKPLKTERKVQDFIDSLKVNFEKKGDTCFSPRIVLKRKEAHCIEASILAYLIMKIHGKKAWLVDLTSVKSDYDHVVCVFQKNKKWGAISKNNHGVLRYRDPIYNSIRELVMSYFHEYTDKKGRKNLRSYSNPLTLSRFDRKNWATSKEDLWYIAEYLADVKHSKILDKKQISNLRKADDFEIKIREIEEVRERFK